VNNQKYRQLSEHLHLCRNSGLVRKAVKFDLSDLLQPLFLVMKQGWDLQGCVDALFHISRTSLHRPVWEMGVLISFKSTNFLSQKRHQHHMKKMSAAQRVRVA
jgi:hypothetical protein